MKTLFGRSIWVALTLLLVVTIVTTSSSPGSAQDSQGWGSLKSQFAHTPAEESGKAPAVLMHPVYGFGFTVAPGITGAEVDQLCQYIAGQTPVSLYDIEQARFEYADTPGRFVVAMIGSDASIHGALVEYSTGEVLYYLHLVQQSNVRVLYDGEGTELAWETAGTITINTEKFFKPFLCHLAFRIIESVLSSVNRLLNNTLARV